MTMIIGMIPGMRYVKRLLPLIRAVHFAAS